jgi:hypothetical protein
MQIAGGGTLMTFCANTQIDLIGNCPSGFQVHYSISAGSRPGLWMRQNLTNPSEPTGGLAVARGGSTQGTWGASTVTATSYSRAVLRPDAPANVQSATISILGGPLGIRSAQTPATESYFLMQSNTLFAMIGARDVPATAGYLQLGLID